jgi:hypothetical protein
MSSYKLHEKSIMEYLASKSIIPAKENDYKAWFISPFRNEKTPSFMVDKIKNKWYDFGEYQGGNIIDLLRKMHNITISEAFDILRGISIAPYTPFRDVKENSYIPSGIKITQKHPLIRSYALLNYLKDRQINISFAQQCENLYEVDYQIGNKKLFGIGFRNDSGGFEIRNTFDKKSTSPKDIYTINDGTDTLDIYEGFMDYLSALTYYNTPTPTNTSIILNGVGNAKKIIPLLNRFKQINLYTDNDSAGFKVVELVGSNHQNIINKSKLIYPNYNDFNDFLTRKTA